MTEAEEEEEAEEEKEKEKKEEEKKLEEKEQEEKEKKRILLFPWNTLRRKYHNCLIHELNKWTQFRRFYS